MNIEQTFGMIKPDVYKNNKRKEHAIAIVNDINFSGLKLIEAKKTTLSLEQVTEFYKEHSKKDWFPILVEYMTSGPVLLMRIEGKDAIQKYRDLCGATDPSEAKPGTLRQKYGKSRDENSVHSSDSLESAKRELAFFF